ncbi:uncharacterized protein LOC121300179 [Polyodon spathula]|uniref:uncharacterized protein LOC121300179 n=1 Tax=Polyodon spathula TaxID=7913 RepID=UPI001B7DD0D7|nr:uncharacterized protein LOC121300179 [Polyodon spathula]
MEHGLLFISVTSLIFECRAEDTVTQPPGNMNAVEGQSVTLDCKYSTSYSSPYVFWYIQHPIGSPRYVLRRDTFGTGENADLNTSQMFHKFQLQIAPDSRGRFVVLRMEQERTWVTVLLFCFSIKRTRTDSVTQLLHPIVLKQRESTIIQCKYETATTAPTLFWYIQDPNQAPQLILSGYYQAEDILPMFQNRFPASPDKTEKNSHLNITGAGLFDSATYFCALSSTLWESQYHFIQKPPAACRVSLAGEDSSAACVLSTTRENSTHESVPVGNYPPAFY